MNTSIELLADVIDGDVLGDGKVAVSRLLAIDEAKSDAIVPLLRKRLLPEINELPAAVLADEPLAEEALRRGIRAAIVHSTPALLLSRAIDYFFPASPNVGEIHGSAVVDPSAYVHATAQIGPFAVVADRVRIGEGSVVGAHALISSGCVIGERVVIGPGAVIGHEGFGFVPTRDGPVKIRQVGRVVIENDVEIGAHTCIDRATLGTTRIGRGSKIDNLVQVGHNAKVGNGVLMAGQVGLAGSTTVCDGVLLGGQVGVADHLTIGEGARVAAKSGVTGDVPAHAVVAGYPAMPHKKWLKAMAILKRRGIVADDTEVS